MSHVARNHTGHRIGEQHGRAVHTDATVRQARELKGRGLGYKRIGKTLQVSPRTVADWCRYDTRWNA